MTEKQIDLLADHDAMSGDEDAVRAARHMIIDQEPTTETEVPVHNRPSRGRVAMVAAATGAALGLAAGGATALAIEDAINHSEPTAEELQAHALSWTTITPSLENGDLISSAEEGVAFLSERALTYDTVAGEDKPVISIPYERIVTESQEAQKEYSRLYDGAQVQQGAKFKLYLLEKDDGSFDIEINPEASTEQ